MQTKMYYLSKLSILFIDITKNKFSFQYVTSNLNEPRLLKSMYAMLQYITKKIGNMALL